MRQQNDLRGVLHCPRRRIQSVDFISLADAIRAPILAPKPNHPFEHQGNPVMSRILFRLATAVFLAVAVFGPAQAANGIAMQGEPALPPGYTHFPYANPDAPKGGAITYCVVGSFDNLNPFILKSLRTTARGVISGSVPTVMPR
jgi:hypothetical protein